MREEAGGWVYILASKRFGTLYTGSARNIVKRVHEHREALLPGFMRKYGVSRLVWFEGQDGVAAAQKREQQTKRWRRAWKIALIEEQNLHWQDLYPALAGFSLMPTLSKQAIPPALPGQACEARAEPGPRVQPD